MHLCTVGWLQKGSTLDKGPFALIIKSSLAIGNNILGILLLCENLDELCDCIISHVVYTSKHFKCFDSFSFCIHKFIWLEFVQIFPGEIIEMISQWFFLGEELYHSACGNFSLLCLCHQLSVLTSPNSKSLHQLLCVSHHSNDFGFCLHHGSSS